MHKTVVNLLSYNSTNYYQDLSKFDEIVVRNKGSPFYVVHGHRQA